MRSEINEIENEKQRKSRKQNIGSLKTSIKLTNLQQEKRERKKAQMTSIKNETGDITTDPADL